MVKGMPWWGLALAVIGCRDLDNDAEVVLVEVGAHQITAQELAHYEQGLPESGRTTTGGAKGKREHLQSLVDRQLLLTEAGKQGIDQLPGLHRVLSELTVQRLVERRRTELVDAQVKISEQELLDIYRQSGAGWEIRPAHILSATQAEAQEVVRQLRAGADFHELARKRSRADDAFKGGDLGSYFGPDDAVPALRDAVFGRPVGFVSEPVQTRDGWEVVKVLDKREVPFAKIKGAIAARLRRQRSAERQATVLAELELLADSLLLLSARGAGLDRDPELLAWQSRQREELMLAQLRLDEVGRRVEVTEDEARAYYQANLARYTSVPGPIELTEVIVETRQEADAVLKAARSGERLERLAVRHSVRPRLAPVNGHAVGDSGHLRVDTLISSPYRDFLGDHNTQAVGKIQGPLTVQDRYSIFRLDQPVTLVPFPFEQARVRVARRLRTEREGARWAAFLDSLRSVYEPQVRWHDDRIARLTAAAGTEPRPGTPAARDSHSGRR